MYLIQHLIYFRYTFGILLIHNWTQEGKKEEESEIKNRDNKGLTEKTGAKLCKLRSYGKRSSCRISFLPVLLVRIMV